MLNRVSQNLFQFRFLIVFSLIASSVIACTTVNEKEPPCFDGYIEEFTPTADPQTGMRMFLGASKLWNPPQEVRAALIAIVPAISEARCFHLLPSGKIMVIVVDEDVLYFDFEKSDGITYKLIDEGIIIIV